MNRPSYFSRDEVQAIIFKEGKTVDACMVSNLDLKVSDILIDSKLRSFCDEAPQFLQISSGGV